MPPRKAIGKAAPERLTPCRGPLSFLVLCMALAFCAKAFAGPPFLTDDPEPVEYGHYEFYAFSTADRGPDGTTLQAPAFEFNAGVAPDTQFHIVFPLALLAKDGPAVYGPGDTEIGIKYRFWHESKGLPQVGAFPMIELPTGSASRGLGNGRVQEKIPVWAQKSFGPWTTYGGMGYMINPAPGARDFLFVGWLIQRDLSKKLMLGGEVFAQGAQEEGGQGTAILNFGGYYNFTKGFSLLFSAGHSVVGERHLVAYLGLYWTGPFRAGQSTAAVRQR